MTHEFLTKQFFYNRRITNMLLVKTQAVVKRQLVRTNGKFLLFFNNILLVKGANFALNDL